MATTLRQVEAPPESYPTAAMTGWSAEAAALSEEMLWARIESYIAFRFSERDVIWTVEGPGEWHPPLTPVTIESVEVWSRAGEFEPVELDASPLGGFYLPCTGPYLFTGTVGNDDDPLPEIVREAVRRFAEYIAAAPGKPGVSYESMSVDELVVATRRDVAHIAMAMQNSGAADLLRKFRTVP